MKEKTENNNLKLYKLGTKVMLDVNGQTYWSPIWYLRGMLLGGRPYCYLSKWWSEEERKIYLEKKEAKIKKEEIEFKEKVKQSLRG